MVDSTVEAEFESETSQEFVLICQVLPFQPLGPELKVWV